VRLFFWFQIFGRICFTAAVRIATEYQIQDFDVVSIGLETLRHVGAKTQRKNPLPASSALKFGSARPGRGAPKGKTVCLVGDGIPTPSAISIAKATSSGMNGSISPGYLASAANRVMGVRWMS
jgi:hypothetical protein